MILEAFARGQTNIDDLTSFDGTITTGGTAQTLIPQQLGRTAFYFENTSSANLTVYVGPPAVSVTLTSGVITSFTVADNGLGWLFPPVVTLLGGVFTGNTLVQPGGMYTGPQSQMVKAGGSPAIITANALSGGALNGFTIVSGGSGYIVKPDVKLINPWPQGGGGAGTPTATVGFLVVANGSLSFEHTFCPTSAMNIFGATTGQTYTCKVCLT